MYICVVVSLTPCIFLAIAQSSSARVYNFSVIASCIRFAFAQIGMEVVYNHNSYSRPVDILISPSKVTVSYRVLTAHTFLVCVIFRAIIHQSDECISQNWIVWFGRSIFVVDDKDTFRARYERSKWKVAISMDLTNHATASPSPSQRQKPSNCPMICSN